MHKNLYLKEINILVDGLTRGCNMKMEKFNWIKLNVKIGKNW